MNNDRIIRISTGASRRAAQWIQQEVLLSELYERLKTPVRSSETLAEYLSLKKGQQDDLKDVGGFVGGTLADGKRRANSVTGRDIIVLDLDNLPTGGTEDILRRLEGLGCGYCCYSTRKHRREAPRLRVMLPLDRTVTADEFEPISRRMAWYIQPEMTFFDKTTFEPSRLMYYPSVSSDSEYIYQTADKPFLSADGLLATYADWQDVAQWPQVPGATAEYTRLAKRQADPETKPGTVGAFCRVYDIRSAMAKFLNGVYEQCGTDDRYTYTGGSTVGGAVLYENGKFLYSHHATDPAGGKLCNAFDLVRLHLFAEKDDSAKPDTPANKLPSFVEMCKLAVADSNVATLINKERHDAAVKEFGGIARDNDNIEWMKKLKINESTGAVARTTDNALIILENDPLLKGRIAEDDFSHRITVLNTLPWDFERPGRRIWDDSDESGVRWYMEQAHGITGKEKISDAVAICARRHAFDDVKDYLDTLQWDGVPRLDTLFIDYLGAGNNDYVRAVTRKAFVAAVARTYRPGNKFDIMTILAGKQGIGKSTLLRKMGRHKWFTDSIRTFEGKELCELIQGMWIIEISELEALNKADSNRVKQIMAQEIDRFRAAYGRHVQDCPRRCIFFGTTNNGEFLKDRTGNRRFWPVDTGEEAPTKSVFSDLDGEVDMLWAEAVHYYKQGEPLILPKELEKCAEQAQEDHRTISVHEGLIRDYLERKVPPNWNRMTLPERQVFLNNNDAGGQELVERDRVCALEIWREVLGGGMKDIRYSDTTEINGIISKMPGWEKLKKPMRFGYCGVQKGFIKT
ncbi:MAG: virulence-associated E family protein [bacterium]|nr:virulence-associated E family protein [bacterium]